MLSEEVGREGGGGVEVCGGLVGSALPRTFGSSVGCCSRSFEFEKNPSQAIGTYTLTTFWHGFAATDRHMSLPSLFFNPYSVEIGFSSTFKVLSLPPERP